jgi:hypothetical protein
VLVRGRLYGSAVKRYEVGERLPTVNPSIVPLRRRKSEPNTTIPKMYTAMTKRSRTGSDASFIYRTCRRVDEYPALVMHRLTN